MLSLKAIMIPLIAGAGFLHMFSQRSVDALSFPRSKPIYMSVSSNSPKKIFVAGATGRTGMRVVRELLQSNLSVRAGVRESSLSRAEDLYADTKFLEPGLREKLELETVDLADTASLSKSLEGCDVVVCALGALESEVLNWRGPFQVDGVLTQNLIKAASAKPEPVRHFVLVSSLGTAKFGWPASILNLFWGVLIWKRQSEVALINAGIPYTIVRPGGMERPKDDYELTHNLKLLPPDSTSGGQVSRLQVAKLISTAIQNPEVSTSKIVEAIAETDAPKVDSVALLESISPEVSDSEWKARLTQQQYYVLRQAGTERPWTSELNKEKRKGTYCCAGCGAPLFPSSTKYESGSGWPSFYQPVSKDAIREEKDLTLGMLRVETLCRNCGGHLGHVFEDGPRPTGLRYCMNGVALSFKPEQEEVEEEE
mmetsp:Transcript_33907/g.44728  ORF Transcript_33907/g.44728 Transcript_33907/m.44728 type:complete len:425 (-) Transcript_33907:211-1485(-)